MMLKAKLLCNACTGKKGLVYLHPSKFLLDTNSAAFVGVSPQLPE